MLDSPISTEKLAEYFQQAAQRVVRNPVLGHHLAKAAVERWLAFELAAILDELVAPIGWTCLIECGGAKGVGNFDLLLAPSTATVRGARLVLDSRSLQPSAVAVELKAAHVSHGEKHVTQGLFNDLTMKPWKASKAQRHCAGWFGMLITTSGLWQGSQNHARTQENADRFARGEFDFGSLTRTNLAYAALRYREWQGDVWIDLLEPTYSALGAPVSF
jgi:hypothetical protein